MVSNIDPTQPITGVDQPVQVIRDNFSRAKLEIEDLQLRKLDRNGDVMLGVLQLAPFVLASLPPPASTTGGMVFVADATPPSAVFSDGTNWISFITGITVV